MAEKKRVPVALTEEQVSNLRKVCSETGLSMSGVMALAFSEWFSSRERRENARAGA